MELILPFLICFSSQYSSNSSIFVGRSSTRLNFGHEKSNILIEFFFYKFINGQDEFILEPINSNNISIDEISAKNDFLYVFGTLFFEKSNFSQSKELISGIYQRNTSEIYMIFNLDNFISEELIKLFNNHSIPLKMTNESELFQFLNKMKEISEEFNYTEQKNNITKKEIKESKLKYKKEKSIKQEKDGYFRKQIIVDRLQQFSIEKFQSKIPNSSEEI